MDRHGRCKIADFGVAHFFDVGSQSATSGTLKSTEGTYHFMAPECCNGSAKFSGFGADLWAMGVTLYVMLYGPVPFFEDNPFDLFEAISKRPVQYPSDPAVSEDLGALLRLLLCKDAEQRLTLRQLKVHPWLTQHGTQPMPDAACTRVVVSEIEIRDAIESAPTGVLGHVRQQVNRASNAVRALTRRFTWDSGAEPRAAPASPLRRHTSAAPPQAPRGGASPTAREGKRGAAEHECTLS